MAAQFKSNVRLREEKGIGSISMKRLIFCGVGAVLVFMLLRLTPLAGIALPAQLGIFMSLLILTGSRGGIPLWQRITLGWRGRLLLAAARQPDGLAAQAAQVLSIDTATAHLHATNLFQQNHSDHHKTDWSDWVVYADLTEAESNGGLRFVTIGEGHDGEPF